MTRKTCYTFVMHLKFVSNWDIFFALENQNIVFLCIVFLSRPKKKIDINTYLISRSSSPRIIWTENCQHILQKFIFGGGSFFKVYIRGIFVFFMRRCYVLQAWQAWEWLMLSFFYIYWYFTETLDDRRVILYCFCILKIKK